MICKVQEGKDEIWSIDDLYFDEHLEFGAWGNFS